MLESSKQVRHVSAATGEEYAYTVAALNVAQRMQIMAQGSAIGTGTYEAVRMGILDVAVVEKDGTLTPLLFGATDKTPGEAQRPRLQGTLGGWTDAQLDSMARRVGDALFATFGAQVFNLNHVSGEREKNSGLPTGS